MEEIKWASTHFLHLKEHGLDIDSCQLDLTAIAIDCDDIARYKKAFRVKIRTLIKEADTHSLKECFEKFYSLARFTHYLYGFHSCSSEVSLWQKRVALALQKEFEEQSLGYKIGVRSKYEEIDYYEKHFKTTYMTLYPHSKDPTGFVQDEKPFLTLKDYAHLDQWYITQIG